MKVYKYFLKLFIVLITLMPSTFSSIIEFDNWQEIALFCNSHAQSGPTVICLDLDFTTTRPTHPATDPANAQRYSEIFIKLVAEANLRLQDVQFATALTAQELMETEVPQHLQTFREHTTVIGLTSRYSGYFAGADFERHTIQTLESLGLSFNGRKERTVFEELPRYRDTHPTLNEGIIFCNDDIQAKSNKPKALAAYLAKYANDTQCVIVIDDDKRHLESLLEFLSKEMSGIQFFGLYYVKAKQSKPRECTESDFETYVQSLIGILTQPLPKPVQSREVR